MLLNALILITTLVPHAEAGADALARALPPPATVSAPADSPPPRFDPATRSVSNWHGQTGAQLTPRALAITASLADDPPYVARCVRLNNGWCSRCTRNKWKHTRFFLCVPKLKASRPTPRSSLLRGCTRVHACGLH